MWTGLADLRAWLPPPAQLHSILMATLPQQSICAFRAVIVVLGGALALGRASRILELLQERSRNPRHNFQQPPRKPASRWCSFCISDKDASATALLCYHHHRCRCRTCSSSARRRSSARCGGGTGTSTFRSMCSCLRCVWRPEQVQRCAIYQQPYMKEEGSDVASEKVSHHMRDELLTNAKPAQQYSQRL